MDKKLSFIKERILYVSELKGFGREEFCEKIDMTYGNFKGKLKEKPINSNALEKILSIIPDLNPYWLLTGEGAVFINENKYAQNDQLAHVNEGDTLYHAKKDLDEVVANKVVEKLNPLLERVANLEKQQQEVLKRLDK